MIRLLQQITAISNVPDTQMLKRLIDSLRVSPNEPEKANEKIEELIQALRQHPEYGQGLASFILHLVNQYRQLTLYTDTGILSDYGFFYSLSRLVGHRFLPLLPEEDSIVELVAEVFDQKNDDRWLASIDPQKWDELIALINIGDQNLDLVASVKNNILNGIIILSYRISGIGLHPDLMGAYPQMLNYCACFVAQNQEAVLFVNQYRSSHKLDTHTDVMPDEDVDPAPLLVMLEQCQDVLVTLRKRIYKTGISIRLTNMMMRLEQSLQRMQILTELLADNHADRDKAIIELIEAVIQTAKQRYSFRYLIDNNTKLLSKKVTENASHVGEHYISTDKAGYKEMFKKASIGGFFIAFMATMKILAYNLVLAPIGRAFVNSMIYGLGFVFIHVIHGTVATKQPAMTAAAIASTISENKGKKTHQLNKLSELIVDILRTQFVAIMGNVLIAMPVAFLISFAWLQYYGVPMIDTKEAHHLLEDLNPFTTLALPHAAIAGVYLFLAGLIAGYYDNLAVYNKIGERIQRHWLLLKIMPVRWVDKLGTFVENNLGAIMGNFLFGVFLGSTATVGYILGLRLDIRHIAFSSANFAHGIFNSPADDISVSLVLISLLGVALIGLMNLLVSFALALIVALRSKDVQFFEWSSLAKYIFAHLRQHPLDFFVPRNQPMQYAKIDSYGQMIFDDTVLKAGQKPIDKKYVVRRLSDIKVLDDQEPNVVVDNASDQTPSTSANEPSMLTDQGKKQVVLDDGLDNLSSEADTYDDVHVNQDNKENSNHTKDSPEPLPKPKKPPKLPD
ncbi:site-specific recombinase [Psychrobacter sp. I-STPA10]|uniref:site-specific recombinase n=1 Tax=Psychrobacter sp. I-STPA10 TaxID=2585769 RepID=UPI001E573BED|nr:site-specific recombinase [Psychrobacter sp. I-STPA10]